MRRYRDKCANRLASNSLLEGNVVARRALADILKTFPFSKQADTEIPIPDWETGNATQPDEQVLISHNWDEIRRLMWDYVSIVRTDNRLNRAARRLRNLRKEVREFYWGNTVNSDILELRNLVATGMLISYLHDTELRRF